MPRTFEPIATTTISTNATSVTLSFNAAGYRDLRIVVCSLSSQNGGSNYIGFNTDNITFNNRQFAQRGTSNTVQNYGTLYLGQAAYTTTTNFTNYSIDIYNSNGSTRQGLIMRGANGWGTAAQANLAVVGAGATSTVALTAVVVREWTGYLVQAGTVITVWGIA